MRRLFIDAGAFIAQCAPDDRRHRVTAEGFRNVGAARLVTSDLVISEAATWLRYHVSLRRMLALRDFLRSLRQLEVVHLDPPLEQEAWDLLERVDDLALSFADAVAVTVVKRERCDAVFGFDTDFLSLGIPLYPGTGVGESPVPYVATPLRD